jgi:hypothetical protein
VSGPIIHTPYDLGLGITLGDKREADATGTCYIQTGAGGTALLWEVVRAPKPLLLITFDHCEVIRELDETWLSIETNSERWVGIDGSFARTVQGGEFPTSRENMEMITGPVTHYQFVTMGSCVDVLSQCKPKARFVELSDLQEYRLGYLAP